jgi:SdrD B-like domain
LQYASATYAGDPTQDALGKAVRPIDQGSLDFSLSGPINNSLSLGMRTFTRRNGLADPLQSDSVGGGANIGFTISQWDVGINADISTVSARSLPSNVLANISAPLEKTDADRLTLTLDKRFEHLVTSVRMEKTESRGAIQQRQRAFAATAGLNPWMLSGLRGQTLSFTSALNASWSRGETLFGESRSSGVTLSASLSFQSGNLFGERLRVSANTGLSRTQTSNAANLRASAQSTLDNLISGNTQKPLDATNTISSNSNGWYYNVRSQYAIARGLNLEFGINKALGQPTFGYLQLTGLLTGVAQRPNLLPRPRHGVVQGRIYLDKNRNSIEDKDELGLPNVVVRLGGTPWQLRTDNNGNFTINNVPQGAYFITVDVTSLPIGYRIESKNMPRISVLDQEVTEIVVPIEISGQLRGRLFVDANNNGLADRDETGPIGRAVILIGPATANGAGMTQETQTSVFGQFLFDGLAIGRYQLKVGEKIIEIELLPDATFATRDIVILE